ncbi:MAG: C-GCAxxG-C-C family protein [Myxococcota bacterium]
MSDAGSLGADGPDDARRAELVRVAREKARVLYAGVLTPHRSCGIALAETFGRATAPYQSLRRGGILGLGECGAIVAGRLVLGEMLGNPDPTGAVTPALRAAMQDFEALWHQRVDRGRAPGDGIVCNTLTGQFASFTSPERHAFCTDLATEVATCVAEVLLKHGVDPGVVPWPGPASTPPTDETP